MKKPRCASCKKVFTPPIMGRRPQYCSQACRQRAYRNRVAKKSVPCEILKRDLYSMEDREARFKAAVKVLEELGFEVTLQKRERQQPKKTRHHLKLVKPNE